MIPTIDVEGIIRAMAMRRDRSTPERVAHMGLFQTRMTSALREKVVMLDPGCKKTSVRAHTRDAVAERLEGKWPIHAARVKDGGFFTSLQIGEQLFIGEVAVTLAGLIQPLNCKNILVEASLDFVEFYIPDRDMNGIMREYSQFRAGQIMEQLTEAADWIQSPDLFDEEYDERCQALYHLLTRSKTGKGQRDVVKDRQLWSYRHQEKYWRSLCHFLHGCRLIYDRAHTPAIRNALQKMTGEVTRRAMNYCELAPDFTTIHRILHAAAESIPMADGLNTFIEAQEAADGTKLPSGKGLLTSAEEKLESAIQPFLDDKPNTFAFEGEALLRILGVPDIRTAAKEFMCGLLFTDQVRSGHQVAQLIADKAYPSYRLQSGYVVSTRAAPQSGRGQGGKFHQELELLRARIALQEPGFEEPLLLKGVDEFMREFEDNGFSMEWLKIEKAGADRLMVQSARELYRKELEHKCDGCMDPEFHPVRVAQVITDEKNNKWRGLLNSNGSDVYGGPCKLLAEVMEGHWLCYGRAQSFAEAQVMADELNECLFGENLVIAVSDDGKSSTCYLNRDVPHGMIDGIKEVYRDQFSEDDEKACRMAFRDTVIARPGPRKTSQYHAPLGRDLATPLQGPEVTIGREFVDFTPPAYRETAEACLLALRTMGEGPTSLQAGTGEGKTASTILGAVEMVIRNPGLRVEVIMPAREDVNSMCRTLTGRSPFDATAAPKEGSLLARFYTWMNVTESKLGFTHGETKGEIRKGQVLVTTALSCCGRQDRERAGIIIIDEADNSRETVSLALGWAAQEGTHLMLMSATPRTDDPIVPPTRRIKVLKQRRNIIIRQGGGKTAAARIVAGLSIPAGEKGGAIALVLVGSIGEQVRVRTQLKAMGIDSVGYDGCLPAEARMAALETPEDGRIKVVVSTDASRRADLQNIGVVVMAGHQNLHVFTDHGTSRTATFKTPDSSIQQGAGRAGRSKMYLLLCDGQAAHGVCYGDAPTPVPDVMLCNPYEAGLRHGSNNLGPDCFVVPMTARQQWWFTRGCAEGRRAYEIGGGLPQVSARILAASPPNMATAAAVLILGDQLHLGVSRESLRRSQDDGTVLRCCQQGWRTDPGFAKDFLAYDPPAVLGSGWMRLHQDLMKLAGELPMEGEIDWDSVAWGCPDFVGHDGRRLCGAPLLGSAPMGICILVQGPHGQPDTFIACTDGPPMMETTSGHIYLSVLGNTLRYQPHDDAPDVAEALRQWKSSIMNRDQGANLKDDILGWQKSGWSLADRFSVFGLAFCKELQQALMRRAVASPEFHLWCYQQPERPEFIVHGHDARVAVLAVFGSCAAVGLELNQAQTLFSVVYAREGNPSPAGAMSGATCGDDAVSLVKLCAPVSQTTNARGVINFTQNVSMIEAKEVEGGLWLTGQAVHRLKIRNLSEIASACSPSMCRPFGRKSALRIVSEFRKIDPTHRFDRQIQRVLLPFVHDSIEYTHHIGRLDGQFLLPHLAGLPTGGIPIEVVEARLQATTSAISSRGMAEFCKMTVATGESLPCTMREFEDYKRFWESWGGLYMSGPCTEPSVFPSAGAALRAYTVESEAEWRIPVWFAGVRSTLPVDCLERFQKESV